jgi:hypothetical protein
MQFFTRADENLHRREHGIVQWIPAVGYPKQNAGVEEIRH